MGTGAASGMSQRPPRRRLTLTDPRSLRRRPAGILTATALFARTAPPARPLPRRLLSVEIQSTPLEVARQSLPPQGRGGIRRLVPVVFTPAAVCGRAGIESRRLRLRPAPAQVAVSHIPRDQASGRNEPSFSRILRFGWNPATRSLASPPRKRISVGTPITPYFIVVATF